jgi:pimeloyl-ACP methyl ester carboxylesterase
MMRVRPLVMSTLLLPLTLAAPAFPQEPASTAPIDWPAMSINLEDVPYPYPVEYLSFTVEGHDVRMAYMDVPPARPANGRTAVLLHGMNFFAEAWTSTIEVLSRAGFRVVAVDQIGFGRSSKPVLHYSFNLHAANTRRLVTALGLTRVDLISHSMGGMVASRFASSYPELVDHLVMINQIGLTDARATRPWRDTTEVYKAQLARDYAEILRGMRAYYVTWKPEYMKYVRIHYGWTRSGEWPRLAMVRALQQQAIYADPVVDDWPRIRARTLVIGGERDGANYPEQARNAARLVPGGRVHVISGVGHNPHFEAPDRLFPVVLAFLQGEQVGELPAAER